MNKEVKPVTESDKVKFTHSVEIPNFSYFKKPIKNTQPYCALNLFDVYLLIKDNTNKQVTNELRTFTNEKEAKQYKASNFDYVTFSGVFTARNDKSLSQHSFLLTIDLDDITNLEETKRYLLNDEYFETELLFISPSGKGLKWIVKIDLSQDTHRNYFLAISNYLLQTYNLIVDPSGKDISRACFIGHDSEVFINPIYQPYEEKF